MAPSARLEHATYCSASKRSNPLSYEGRQGSILSQLDMVVKCCMSNAACADKVQEFRDEPWVEVFTGLALDVLNGILL